MSIKIEDLNEVYTATFEARNKWKNILLGLGISLTIIDGIEIKCHNIPEDCYREGLGVWLRDRERRWEDLAKALYSPTVGHKDLAREIKRDRIHSTSTTDSQAGTEIDKPVYTIGKSMSA